jgi:hypothetical protein
MDLSDNLFNLIFDSSGSFVSPEQAIVSHVLNRSSDNIDKMFAIVQIYEYGQYIKFRIANSMGSDYGRVFIVDTKIFYLMSKIMDQMDDGFQGEISIYTDEYYLVDGMFSSMLDFYERLEDYTRCAFILRIRDSFFKIAKNIS